MIDLNNYQSIDLRQLFDSFKFPSGSESGYHLVIDFCIVLFYMLMILMKLSCAPQTFFRIFFLFGSRSGYEQDQDHDITSDFHTRPTFYT